MINISAYLTALRVLVFTTFIIGGCSSSESNNDEPAPIPDSAGNDIAEEDEMLCPAGALYDADEDVCFIDCTGLTDDQCDALDQSVFGDFDEFIDSEFSGASVNAQDSEMSEQTIAEYTIENDLQLTQLKNEQPENEQQFQQIWESANALLPQVTLKQTLSEFHISTDGVQGILAYVTTDDNQPEKWIIGFDPADYTTSKDSEFIHTTIHEFGHIVFLNIEQVNMTELGDCPNYAIAEGCTLESSFINRFFQRFWLDIFDEHTATVGPDELEQNVTAFYEQYQDQFVSEYAATNPVEDAAEVFTRFVLSSKPEEGGTIAQQKIRSLYEFAELVRLRNIIRAKLNAM
ncbi:MAG: hypothetical protein AB8B64_05485 [Granulosicoccus sp.]